MQAMHLEETPVSHFMQLHNKYSGEVLVTPRRLFDVDTPCILQLPDGARLSCFYQGSDRHNRFADGWPAVSEALGLAPTDIVQLRQLPDHSTEFLVAKVSADTAAAAGFKAKPMSEAERIRRTTTISADGTVLMPLSEAALRRRSPGLAPAALQLWGVDTAQSCTLVLPSGRQQSCNIHTPRPGINAAFKSWPSAAAELQLQASDTLRLHMLQQHPLRLHVSVDRTAAVGASAGQQAGQGAAVAAGCAASASAGGPSAAGSAPAAEAASWQQWCSLQWRGTRLVIPERQHLFPVVGTCGQRPCTLLLPDGQEVKGFALTLGQTGVSLSDGIAVVKHALQLQPGSLLQFSQVAPGSRRFHVQKLPPDAATIPPLQDHYSEMRQRRSTAVVLPDGTVSWPATACVTKRLHLPAAVAEHLQLTEAGDAVFQLSDGQQYTLGISIRAYNCDVTGSWRQLAVALQVAAGDLLHLRVSQRAPLRLQLHVTHPDGSPKPLAAPVQQAPAPQPQPQSDADAEAAAAAEATALEAAAAPAQAPTAAADVLMLDAAQAPADTAGEAAADTFPAPAGSADAAASSVAAHHSPATSQSQQLADLQLQLLDLQPPEAVAHGAKVACLVQLHSTSGCLNKPLCINRIQVRQTYCVLQLQGRSMAVESRTTMLLLLIQPVCSPPMLYRYSCVVHGSEHVTLAIAAAGHPKVCL
jgi:hypothetical protein